jgi:hypothetical protein
MLYKTLLSSQPTLIFVRQFSIKQVFKNQWPMGLSLAGILCTLKKASEHKSLAKCYNYKYISMPSYVVNHTGHTHKKFYFVLSKSFIVHIFYRWIYLNHKNFIFCTWKNWNLTKTGKLSNLYIWLFESHDLFPASSLA